MRSSDVGPERVYFRTEARVFNQNGAWYFATREGDQGPFARQDIAWQEASRYASECTSLGSYHDGLDGSEAAADPVLTPHDVRRASRFRSWGRLAFKFS
jgi:hypothetical protein